MRATLTLMLRMLWRDWRAGELTVLGVALVVAVASLTSVSFLTDRVAQALTLEAHQLLGGDLLLTADHAWGDRYREQAHQRGLRIADSIVFPSMAANAAQGQVQLAEIKAVGAGYPLRGVLRTAPGLNQPDAERREIPVVGTVWLDERLMAALQVTPGEFVRLGSMRLQVTAVLTQEPDRGVNLIALAPRLLLNTVDLPATGLIQPASRIAYRLHLSGEAQAVEGFRNWVQPQLGRGERLEDLRNARPEVRSMQERAQRFLRLAALLAVVLAAVGVGFAADRYMRRHLDGCAVMRCLGASSAKVLAVHGGEFVLFGLISTLVGCLLGYVVQWGLLQVLSGLLLVSLPLPSWQPWAQGGLVGLALVAGFAIPPLLRLYAVPTLRVLRREWEGVAPLSWGAYAFGGSLLALLMLWIAGEWRLGGLVIGSFTLALLLYALAARGLLALLGAGNPRQQRMAALRMALASLRRHGPVSVMQIAALGLALTALLLLTLGQQNLLASWRSHLPADAPNRFVINIQPEQRQPVQDFFRRHDLPVPHLEPMVRGRLVAINAQAVTASRYEDERARRLIEREFNLSWSSEMPSGNRIVAGRWHGVVAVSNVTELSVEQGLAETLGLKLGDVLTYEVAGQRFSGRITSLRRLEWGSMRVNFFVIAAPGALDHFPASDITSFYLPPDAGERINELVQAFPNLTVIDVSALMRQLQGMLDQVARAVQIVFGFALLAGLLVVYAALQASYDERRHEWAVLRALGARSQQLQMALLCEFALLGGLAGLLGGLGASLMGWALAHFVLQLDYRLYPWMILAGVLPGAVGVALAAWLGMAPVLRRPALLSLRG